MFDLICVYQRKSAAKVGEFYFDKSIMVNLDNQVDYWNRVGPGKPFAHPLNFDRLGQWLSPLARKRRAWILEAEY